MQVYTLQLLIRSLKGIVAALEMEYNSRKEVIKKDKDVVVIIDVNQKSS